MRSDKIPFKEIASPGSEFSKQIPFARNLIALSGIIYDQVCVRKDLPSLAVNYLRINLSSRFNFMKDSGGCNHV